MIIIPMGVSGSWKTTVGQILSRKLGLSFHDADQFHPAENKQKMSQNIPLTDADRWPWLHVLNTMLQEHTNRGESTILACSALKQSYRDALAEGVTDIRWIYLKGGFDFIEKSLSERSGHFFKAALLRSQFDILEEPQDALTLEIEGSTSELIAEAIFLRLK